MDDIKQKEEREKLHDEEQPGSSQEKSLSPMKQSPLPAKQGPLASKRAISQDKKSLSGNKKPKIETACIEKKYTTTKEAHTAPKSTIISKNTSQQARLSRSTQN